MRKKTISGILTVAVAASVTGTIIPFNFDTAMALEEDTSLTEERPVILQDGVNDQWTQENVVEGDRVEVQDGWLHIQPASGSRNNPGTNPSMTVNPSIFDFSKDGYFEFALKSNNANTGVNDSDRFGVYLGYNTDRNGMYIGYDNGGWFWQKYQNGKGAYYTGPRQAAPKNNEENKIRIDWTADHKVTFTLNGKVVFNQEDFSGIFDTMGNKIALKAGSWGETVTNVLLKEIHYTGQPEIETYQISGKVVDPHSNPIAGATIRYNGKTLTTNKDGIYNDYVASGSYTLQVSKPGYKNLETSIIVETSDLAVDTIQLEPEESVETEKISSASMDVYVAQEFPSVVCYEMKTQDLEGKTFYGQTQKIDTIRINGQDIKVSKEDIQTSFEQDKATYTMDVHGDHIDATLTMELKVVENTLSFEITNVENHLDEKEQEDGVYINAIQSIEIPNHSLLSVNTSQEHPNLKGALMSSNTTISGDEYYDINEQTSLNKDYMYAFVSNSEMSAGLWSNAENEGSAKAVGVAGGSHNTRVMVNSQQTINGLSVGLSSTQWYWHRAQQDSKGVWHLVEETANPQAKVAIAGDKSEDDAIDWQDGAVAFRDIMHNPYKSEEVPDLVAYRIAMNFGGQAQNPFLTTLDNVKRVALHTDGLGQSVLLKGYGNEGHDSGHPDYADIGKRIGGVEDMNTLMTKGAEYGAKFGIHVNAGEMYPEAKAFNDDLVRRDSAGNLRYGWNWIDQGIGIDSVYDLGTGSRKERFNALEDEVGSNLDFVYVDIWGNRTGGSDDSWQTRKLSKEINDNGWRMATEWGSANEYDSTFQHWATDLTYGGYTLKGENSEVMRFLRNHQKDSWVGDYPTYGGAAMAPLLGGYNMKDFEGWQGRNDYDTYITNLYTHDLTTKFIQHYKIMSWKDADNSFTAQNPNGGSYTWRPEMKITLRDDQSELVLERKSDDPQSPDYRYRTMTLNGKVVAYGAPSPGNRTNEDIQNKRNLGTETYLLPWIWDARTGEKVSPEDEKLYHWNTQGGTTEWELPDGWSSLANVKVYKLTDLGKTDEQTIPVQNGKITLTAESEVPYVVCKGERQNMDVKWSEGMHIVDAGFNSGNFDAWDKTGNGTAEIAKSQFSNPMMKLTDDVSMTQKLTDLTPGKQYAVLVGVDNRSDAKATLAILSNDKVLASNYTTRSIAKNYVQAYTHSNKSATVDGTSYFQNMYVFFTAPDDGEVTLKLERAKGEGSTYFDDIRIVENESKNITTNDKGEMIRFEQNFENNVQGLYPFVIGGIEGVSDNRIHLSELHEPYTQAGWDVKKMDDVLDGNWSVKINGLTQKAKLAYQTIPQNVRFEPGVTYRVSFDYQAGSDGIYAAAVGVGEFNGNVNLEELPKAMGKDADGHYTCEITGDSSGQTWFGIYSTSKAPDLQGTRGAASNFGGYKELVLDNLVIERVEEDITKDALKQLIEQAKEGYKKSDYESEIWNSFQDVLDKAQVAISKDKEDAQDIENAYHALKGMMITLDRSQGMDATDDSRDIPTENMSATAGSQQNGIAGEGLAEYVLDGNENTIWHTQYSPSVDSFDKQWIELQLNEPTTVAGVRLLQRQGRNGLIKNADILVKKDGEDEYTKVIEATFGTSGWQGVSFDPVQNVTHVKIVPTTTLGDSSNTFSSAAEIRLLKEREEQPITVDTESLEEAISLAESLKEENYTPDTFTALKEKIAAAKEVLSKQDASNYDVLLASANLMDAIKDLKEAEAPQPEPINKEELEALLEEAAQKQQDSYTPDSWKLFSDAYENAQDIFKDENVTQAQVDQAITSLKAGLALLKEKEPEPVEVDKTELKEAIDKAANLNKDAYTEESWKALDEALQNANHVLNDASASNEAVAQAKENVLAAIESLVHLEKPVVDTTRLQETIEQVKQLQSSLYTTESWSALEQKLAEAYQVMEDPNRTEESVQNALDALMQSMTDLVPIEDEASNPVNKAELQKELLEIAHLKEQNYTKESWKRFADLVEEANKVLENPNASQGQVDQVVQALKAAVSNLVENEEPEETVDISKLETFYNECIAYYKEEKYSKENWKQYEQALKQAKSVLEDASATQKDVDQALSSLVQAAARLNEETHSASTAPKDPSTGQENTIHTSLATSPIVWITSSIATLAAIAGLILVKVRRKKK